MSLPLNGTAYTFYIQLTDLSDPSGFLIDPTITAGDFQVSTDGSPLTDLDTLPSVDPAGSFNVLVSLSAAEMTGDKLTIQGIDPDDEWENIGIFLDIPEGTVETVLDIQQGDHIETSTTLTINKRGTLDTVLSKDITGSLLSPSITLRTDDP